MELFLEFKVKGRNISMSPILIKTAVRVPAGTAYEQASPTFCSCHFCDRTVDDDTGFAFDGITMCEDCYNDRVISCDHCGRELWADDNCGDERITLCESCRELDYVSCQCCGRVIHIDDAVYLGGDDPYCDNCADDLDEEGGDSAIHDYNYKGAVSKHAPKIKEKRTKAVANVLFLWYNTRRKICSAIFLAALPPRRFAPLRY